MVYNKYQKIEQKLRFNPKRNYRLVTPCCQRSNHDGKFVNYIDYPEQYGYCHSCGTGTTPPALYVNEHNELFYWDELAQQFRHYIAQDGVVTSTAHSSTNQRFEQQYIPFKWVERYFAQKYNPLLRYLAKQFSATAVQHAAALYRIGSTADDGCIFWQINANFQVCKAKVIYYTEDGRRTNRFKVPFKNEQGYYQCLFGEHLLALPELKDNIVVLVESEKTAVVGSILLDEFIWMSYGGMNGLSHEKLRPLHQRNVVIVPDISNQAVKTAHAQVDALRREGMKIGIWDMTDGKSDDELKAEGIFNQDLEDFFRSAVFRKSEAQPH